VTSPACATPSGRWATCRPCAPDDPPAPGDLPVDLRRPQRLRQPRLRRDGVGQPRRLVRSGVRRVGAYDYWCGGRLPSARVFPGAGRRHPHGAAAGVVGWYAELARSGPSTPRRLGWARSSCRIPVGMRRPCSRPGSPRPTVPRPPRCAGLPCPRGRVGTRRARRGRRPVDPPSPYRRVDLRAHFGGASPRSPRGSRPRVASRPRISPRSGSPTNAGASSSSPRPGP
jgi:hypothetical protein